MPNHKASQAEDMLLSLTEKSSKRAVFQKSVCLRNCNVENEGQLLTAANRACFLVTLFYIISLFQRAHFAHTHGDSLCKKDSS